VNCDSVERALQFFVSISIKLKKEIVLLEISQLQLFYPGTKTPFERNSGFGVEMEARGFVDQITKPEECGLVHRHWLRIEERIKLLWTVRAIRHGNC
jgi:hypothetical protein